MLGFEVRRALQGHRAAAPAVGGVDLGPGEAERRQQLEAGIIERARRDPETVDAESFAQRHLLNVNLTSKAEGSAASTALSARSSNPFSLRLPWLTPGAPSSVPRPST